MPKQRYITEEIILRLRETDVLIGHGSPDLPGRIHHGTALADQDIGLAQPVDDLFGYESPLWQLPGLLFTI